MEEGFSDKWVHLIKDGEVRDGVLRLLLENEGWYYTYPVSVSGKYHKHEPNMIAHVSRCIYFAQQFVKAFNLGNESADILYAGVILHDIGCSMVTANVKVDDPGWKYYEATGWSRKNGHDLMHPIYSSIMIAANPFKHSREIQDLVECHMAHWYGDRCRQPVTMLEHLCCTCDYLASRPELKIEEKSE